MPENHFHLSTVVPFKKWLKTAFFLFVLLLTTHLRAQNPCGTTHSSHQEFSLANARVTNGEPICVNVKFHIVRRDDGTNGFSQANISAVVANLNNAFNPHGIYIYNAGVNLINDTRYVFLNDQAEFTDLTVGHNVSNAINFYLVSGGYAWGDAKEILSNNLFVRNIYALSHIASHELGHCFNLYHTHSGNGCGDGLNCAENSTNCNTCGDLVCDTPPDPCVRDKINSSCQYTGGGGYNPDPRNMMAYGFTSDYNGSTAGTLCMSHFTSEQVERMRAALVSSPTLQAAQATGPNIDLELDPNGNHVYLALIGKDGADINQQGITTVTWETVSNTGGCLGILNGNGLSGFAHGGCSNWSIEAKITATNQCGSTTIYRTIPPPPPFVSYILYQIAPNQYQVQGKLIASNTLAQGLSVPQSTIVPDELEIFVYEFSTGKLVLKTTEPRIDLSRQKQGIYIVKIVINGEITTHKIQKQ